MKNLEKKTSNFFLFMRFYLERRNVTNKKGLFYAKFFEFEEFFHPSFFVGSTLWMAMKFFTKSFLYSLDHEDKACGQKSKSIWCHRSIFHDHMNIIWSQKRKISKIFPFIGYKIVTQPPKRTYPHCDSGGQKPVFYQLYFVLISALHCKHCLQL